MNYPLPSKFFQEVPRVAHAEFVANGVVVNAVAGRFSVVEFVAPNDAALLIEEIRAVQASNWAVAGPTFVTVAGGIRNYCQINPVMVALLTAPQVVTGEGTGGLPGFETSANTTVTLRSGKLILPGSRFICFALAINTDLTAFASGKVLYADKSGSLERLLAM